jgi:hypothetical protein
MPDPVVVTFPKSYDEYLNRCERVSSSPLSKTEYESIRTQYTELEKEFAGRKNAAYETWRLTHHTLITLGLVRDTTRYPISSGNLGAILKLSDYPAANLPSRAEPDSGDQSTSPIRDELNNEVVNILPQGQKLVVFGCLADGRNFLIHEGPASVGRPNLTFDNYGVEMWNNDGLVSYPANVERSPEELRVFVTGQGAFIISHNSGTGFFVPEAEGRPVPIPVLRRKIAGDPHS